MSKISVFRTIQTKYIGPSNFKGTRIKARPSGGGQALVMGYDHSLSIGANHAKAALLLAERMKWTGKHYGELLGGQNADGSYTWIMSESLQEVEA